jgi:AcrR family transcriptional regulator
VDAKVDRVDQRDEVERILDAAWAVLRRSGYDNLKVLAVIRISGVSVGSFYRHFTGKQDLMVAIMKQELKRATAALRELTSSGSPEERVRSWVDAMVSLAFGRTGPRARWFASLPPEVRQLSFEGQGPDGDTGAPLREAIAEGVRTGVFPGANPAQDTFLISSLCSRLDELGAEPLGENREEAVAAVAEFVLAALRNPDRPGPPDSG